MIKRKRVLSIRLSADEYQALKQQADAAGVSVPIHARRLALESVQFAPRLDTLDRLVRDIPDRAGMITSSEKLGVRLATLAAKIDQATATTKGKGATP